MGFAELEAAAEVTLFQGPDESFFQSSLLNSPLCAHHIPTAFHVHDTAGNVRLGSWRTVLTKSYVPD